MALSLYKHFIYGTLTDDQVDSNWTDIEQDVNGLSARLPLNNYAATTDPTANDDVTQGYSAGSLWYNRSNNQIFLLVSANSGAAHWVDYSAVSPLPVDSFGVIRSDVAAMVASVDLRIGISVRTLEHTSGHGYEGGNLYKIVAGGTGTADNGSYIDLDNGLQALALFPNGVNVKHFGAPVNGNDDDLPGTLAALDYLKLQGGGDLCFPDGDYVFSDSASLLDAENIRLHGNRAAKFSKAVTFTGSGGHFYFRNSSAISVEGMTFVGRTPSTTEPGWGDHGLQFSSCKDVQVRGNRFLDIGDGAIVASTYYYTDPIPEEVDSGQFIVSDNVFDNVQQTSTTPGGSETVVFTNNVATNLKGNFKFASRVLGAERLAVSGNIINGGGNHGIDIVGYNTVSVTGNVISGVYESGIAYYGITENGPARDISDVNISSNTIVGGRAGIRVHNSIHPSGDKFALKNIVIVGNSIRDLSRGTLTDQVGIILTGAVPSCVAISANTVSGANSGIRVSPTVGEGTEETVNISISGNSSVVRHQGIIVEPDAGKVLGVNITGNTADGALGLIVRRCSGAVVSANIIKGATTAAQISLSDDFIFSDNLVKGPGSGVNVTSSTDGYISGNRISGVSSFSLRIATESSEITEVNNDLSIPGTYLGGVLGGQTQGGLNRTTGTAAPTEGSWKRGDIVWNTEPAASGTVGWICTSAGAPGTWKEFGTIAA